MNNALGNLFAMQYFISYQIEFQIVVLLDHYDVYNMTYKRMNHSENQIPCTHKLIEKCKECIQTHSIKRKKTTK